MQRYFVDKLDEFNKAIIFGNDYKHIVKVMRLKLGGKIQVVINKKVAIAEIVDITKDFVVVNPVKWLEEHNELPIEVILVCGLLKGDKFDLIVQKGTELGASKFIPFRASRSIGKWEDEKVEKKIFRLQNIAKEAAEQSERGVIPKISKPKSLAEIIEYCGRKCKVKLVAYENSGRSGEKSLFKKSLQRLVSGDKICIIFGPEGGIAPEEIEKLQEAGFCLCGLGRRILRAETAPIVALSNICYELELI